MPRSRSSHLSGQLPPRRARYAILLLAGLLGNGCSSWQQSTSLVSHLPPLVAGENQIIAWVPADQAQTAGVAEAMAHIALAQAKRATEHELCGGTWLFSGTLRQDSATELAQAPRQLGAFQGWSVRISWEPQLSECGISAQRYAQALSTHLPSWMMAQSGQPLALYHRGIDYYQPTNAPRYALAQPLDD